MIKSRLLCLMASIILCSFITLPLENHSRNYPTNVFRSPLGIPLVLAGTFGELRNNHFHAGLDCKTNGSVNYRIYSISEGHVSRIKMSPGGYGNALYIEHPNGYTSVYAHLNSFSDKIQRYVKDQQYAQQTFRIDLPIGPGVLPVTKGEVVALSGNTGSSSAPHLHFEIRDTYTQEAINPLLFGYKIADTRKPSISQVAIYPMDEQGQARTPKVYNAKKKNGIYKIETNIVKVNTSKVGVGIKSYDKQNGANNLNGIYSVEVFDNGNPIFYFDVERIAFDETRYINAHVDFHRMKQGKGRMQKCFLDPGNQLSIYKRANNRGLIDISDGILHKITYEVKDVAGNKSTASMMLQYAPSTTLKNNNRNYKAYFNYASENYYNDNQIQLYFPSGSFYKDVLFNHNTSVSKFENVYSLIHQVHTNKTPVHKYFDVKIAPVNLPQHLESKALIVLKNKKRKSLGGEWEGGFLKAKSRDFGAYHITTDVTPPKIKAINIFNGKNMGKNSTISFSISDNLSGIKSYNCYIDDRWVLMEYDGKTGRLRHKFDGRIGRGSHSLRLNVTDGRDNVKTFTANFTR